MKLICSIALALAILIHPTSSRADSVISGPGSMSCGKIAEDYRKAPTDVEYWITFWAQGFMSGENNSQFAIDGQYRDLEAITVEAQQKSLTSYCDEHPMARFVTAVLDLYGKLPLKKYPPPASR
jgi:hypothetical protein